MLNIEHARCTHKLMLKYSQEPTPELFTLILERVDDVLVGIVYKIATKYFFIEPNIQDLYQCAILGLYKLLVATNEKHKPEMLVGRLYSYARSEIFQKYAIKRKLKHALPKESTIFPVDTKLIQEEQLAYIGSLIDQGIICEEDMQLLQRKFVHNQSVREIVDTSDGKWGKSWNTVNKRIESTLRKIRTNMTEKNIL